MCSRYCLSPSLSEWVAGFIENVVARYPSCESVIKIDDVFPTNLVPIIVKADKQLHAEPMLWGYSNYGNSSLAINARAESTERKPLFRRSFLSGRCVVPTTGFIEWPHRPARKDDRSLFRLQESRVLYLAGISKEVGDERRFVIVTCPANASIADLHDRMPVILKPDQLQDWIENIDEARRIMTSEQPPLIREPAPVFPNWR